MRLLSPLRRPVDPAAVVNVPDVSLTRAPLVGVPDVAHTPTLVINVPGEPLTRAPVVDVPEVALPLVPKFDALRIDDGPDLFVERVRLAGARVPYAPPPDFIRRPNGERTSLPFQPLVAVQGMVFARGSSAGRVARARGMTPHDIRASGPYQRLARGHGAPPQRPALVRLEMLLPLLVPPRWFPSPLYDFQRKGVEWLHDHQSALLADDMGLGKTIQAIVAMRRKFQSGETTRALIVCPKSVQSSWMRHLAEWAPELTSLLIAGDPYTRSECWDALQERRAHLGVITYASLRSDIEQARSQLYDILILDEIQNVKNPATKQSQAVRAIRSRDRWGLSGTPLENSVQELIAIIETLKPGTFPRGGDSIAKAKAEAARIMLRRRKQQVLKDLPPVQSAIEYIGLTSKQRQAYDRAGREGVAELQSGQRVTVTSVLALIMRLKQICNGSGGQSSKLDWLKDYLGIVAAEGDKAIVFSQYVETLTAIEPALASFKPLSYTGSMTTRRRDDTVEQFQKDPDHVALLMSLRAGGTGITLTAASRVVHFDSWWNPAVMQQATARTHRIGQKKTVFETTLVTEATIEERIQQILDAKRALFSNVVDDLSVTGVARHLTEEELFGLFDLQPPRRR